MGLRMGAPDRASRGGGAGWVVVVSVVAGLAAAVVLAFVPLGRVDANTSIGTVLLGFAVGWACLAGLSARFTDEPQRWAVVPAAFMGIAGLAALLAPASVVDVLGWVWPPALLALVVWVFLRARRALRSPTRVWVLGPVLLVLVLCSLGGGYETVSRWNDSRTITMRGDLIDVGPYRLHLECTGVGRPAVVLEPGAGASAATLGWVTDAVARDTAVCVYDRPGLGWSDAAADPPDGAQIASDLHTLLDRAQIPGPYVLAGHSFGGLYVMTFAAEHPEDVAGLVLIDSTAPSRSPAPPVDPVAAAVVDHVSGLVAATAHVGVGRLIAAVGSTDLPPPYRAEVRANAASAKELGSALEEYSTGSRSMSAAGQLRDLDRKPLVVVTAGRGHDAEWASEQQALTSLSRNRQHRVVADATHQSIVLDPGHAAEVAEAIHDVVTAVRTGAPLAHP